MKPLDALIKALEIAKPVTAEIPIPGLNTAVECALSIAKKAKVSISRPRSCFLCGNPQCAALRRSKTLEMTAEPSPNVRQNPCWQYTSSSRTAAAKWRRQSMSRRFCSAYQHSTPLCRFELTRSDISNLLDIENLMARRLRAKKRDRFWLALNCGKIAQEVKTLTTKLEDSHRNFLVQTEQLPSRSIPLMARLSLDPGYTLHQPEHGYADKRESPYATAHRQLRTPRRDCRSKHQRDLRWPHAPRAARQWERHVRWKCEYLNLLTASWSMPS